MGPSAPLPDLRARRLLRQLAYRHASRHFHAAGHPVIASYEPGERWAWCYVDGIELPVPRAYLAYLR